MARRRTAENEDAGAMDSLLDTMTNVVGILVIVLVVVQLGVGDAVQRISEDIKVDPEQLKEKQVELTKVDLETSQLMAQINLFDQVDMPELDLTDQIQAERKRVAQDELLLKNLQQKNIADESMLAKGKAEQAAEKKKREELEQEIEGSMNELTKLRATLDDTPERKTVAANVIKLPNPRPAPEGLVPVSLVCYQNKLYPLNFREVQLAARELSNKIITTKRVAQDGIVDPEKFIAEFSRKPFRNKFFDIKMSKDSQGYPRLTLVPRERAGVTEQVAARKNSQFYKDIKGLDTSKNYIRFFVCGDSYDIYLTARAAAEANNVFVGWIPQPKDWKFSGRMGGPIMLGPPIPPDPNAANRPPPKKSNDEID